jgi:hypothetical protein
MQYQNPSVLYEKRKTHINEIDHLTKKIKLTHEGTNSLANDDMALLGIKWDAYNYSCAYDALFVIFYNTWKENIRSWNITFNSINKYSKMMATMFHDVECNMISIETARDSIRHMLHQTDPRLFPYGQMGCSVNDLVTFMLTPDKAVLTQTLNCTSCNYTIRSNYDSNDYVFHLSESFATSPSAYIHNKLTYTAYLSCQRCSGLATKKLQFNTPPDILAFNFSIHNVCIEKVLKLIVGNVEYTFNIKGIIYIGRFHFTSRIITTNKFVWYHDSRETGSHCISNGHLNDWNTDSLRICRERNATAIIYTRQK